MSYKKLYTSPETTPIEISTDAAMTAALVAENEGKVFKFIGTTGTYTNGDLYIVEEQTITYLPVGGRIFYDNGDNGATYTFYDSSYNVLSTQTVAGLANAVYYTVSGTPSADRWYVYENEEYGLMEDLLWDKDFVSYGVTTNTIGSGKTNTATVLAAIENYDDTIWYEIINMNDSAIGGCNDWFIGSEAEQDQLRASGLVDWYDDYYIWSSVEDNSFNAYCWSCDRSYWYSYYKYYAYCCFGMRSF